MTTHPDALAFLAAILTSPDDDTHRLVYADWLADHGEEERAEFIGVQCELSRWPANDSNVAGHMKLKSRERELFHKLPIPDLFVSHATICNGVMNEIESRNITEQFPRGYYSRGFVSHVTCTAADWLAHADALSWAPPRKCEDCKGGGFSVSPCKVCGNTPDSQGIIDHGRGCRVVDADGGGSEPADDCSKCGGTGEIVPSSMRCDVCRGLGTLEDGDMPCKDCGGSWNCDYHSGRGPVHYQAGAGRIPLRRPLPSHQPIEEVTLTTGVGEVGFERVLAERWPAVRKWHLPNQNRESWNGYGYANGETEVWGPDRVDAATRVARFNRQVHGQDG